MSLISLNHVSKHFGAEEVLRDVTFRVGRGEKVALVGTNGAGKSTILRLVAGLDQPDAGSVSRARNLRIVLLPQEPQFDPDTTLYDTVLEVFQESLQAQEHLRALEGRMARERSNAELVEEYGRLQALVEHAGYNHEERIERVLLGLELDESLWPARMGDLSGGQRTRANLARTLLEDADLLLLDEPTNHLDIAAVEWLENYLHDLKRAFLMVAHDRYLLDRVTKRTVELSNGRTTTYDAPYGRYLELRREHRARQQREFEAQQEEIARTEDFIRRYGAGQRSKEAKGRQKRLDRVERLERPDEEQAVGLRLGRATRAGDVVLEVRDLTAGYGGVVLVRLPPEVTVRRGERVALTGPNGSGKTTLLRTLVGAIPAVSGQYRWGANTSIGYYSQTLAQLDQERTVIAEIQATAPMGEEEARNLLGRYLFSGDDVFKSVSVLSGGERSRVALAKLILEQPNVLVLDEPTNHLDIASRDALEAVLQGFQGTLLFVSHDRFLIDALAEQVWRIEQGCVVRYAGTYTEVAQGQARRLDAEVQPQARTRGRTVEGSPQERLAQLESEVADVASRLAGAGSGASLVHLQTWTDELAEVQALLEEAQRTWLQGLRRELRSSSA